MTLTHHKDERQSAYSCGGSHGLGPFWVVLTVFPINPLRSRSGNRRNSITFWCSGRQATQTTRKHYANNWLDFKLILILLSSLALANCKFVL